MTDIGKVHWSKLWLRPLQCIHHCQEHKAVITASLCMLHPHTYTFYFLYSQTEAVFTNLPAAGISPKSQRATTTHHSESIQSPCSRQWSWCCLGPISVGPGRCWYTMPPRAWLQGETLFLKIQHCVRRQHVTSRLPQDAARLQKDKSLGMLGQQCSVLQAQPFHVMWGDGGQGALRLSDQRSPRWWQWAAAVPLRLTSLWNTSYEIPQHHTLERSIQRQKDTLPQPWRAAHRPGFCTTLYHT